MSHKQGRYTREIRDGQWQRLQWLLPKRKGAGRPIELDLRAVMNAIFYVLVTGCQWRNLPGEYPNPHSVYYHYRKWCLDGTWQRINRTMGYLERRRLGRLGNLLEVVVSAANLGDRDGAKALLTKVERQIALRLLKIWADKGYEGELEGWMHQEWAIALEIVLAAPDQVGFAVQPRRWVVECTFAWFGKFRRLSKDYEYDPLSSESFIYLAPIPTLLKRLAV